jgi:hyperosmotically inducible periplasmic protein
VAIANTVLILFSFASDVSTLFREHLAARGVNAGEQSSRRRIMPRLKIITPLALSAAMLVSLSACSNQTQGTGQSETTGQYVDDATITAKVKAGLLHDQEFKSFDIHVKTEKGVVVLSGLVDNQVQKNDATRVAKGISNVKDVVNDIATRQ